MNINRKSIVRGLAVFVITALAVFAVHAEMHYVTQTVDGYEWRLALDDEAMTASVGTNLTGSSWAGAPNNSYGEASFATSSAINDKTKVEPLVIPSSFTVDGQVYRVTTIGNRALIRAYMTSLIVPEDVGTLYNCSLYKCYNLTNIWFKGHATRSAEFGREYVDLNFVATSVLDVTTAIKNVLVGPNLKRSGNNFKVPGGTNTLVLFPYRKDNTTWGGVNVGGTTPNVVYYHDLDETAGTITFSPTNSTTLADALSTLPTIKSQIKTAFGLDAKIVVSSPIETATAIPVAFLSSGIPLETTEWVAFSATTQEQLDDVLDVCSADSKILIDPAGATGRLVVPYGRNVSVLMPANGEITYDQKGIVIIVK